MKPAYLAAALLLVGVAAQFAWHYAPEGVQARVWGASQAGLLLVVLAALAGTIQHKALRLVCALLGTWQGMTAACSIAWIVRPWPIKPGQAQCSAALDLPLCMLSAWAASLVATEVWRGLR